MPARKYRREKPDEVAAWLGNHLCGCGNHEAAVAVFLEMLEVFQPRDGGFLGIDLQRMEAFEKAHGEGVATLFLYLFTGTGLCEHGGSVVGSWMTKLGEAVREEALTCPGSLV